MSERKWTEAQREAFSSDASDILVSAAAGSGKTAVLTKRILDKLTDPNHPTSISRLLVVTFTKAAAGELKERIRSALLTAMAEHPGNKHLQQQYVRLSGAKITTIHGFCFDLIRQNAELLEMPSHVKVLEETQAKLLMEQVANRIIDNYYASLPGYDDIENFIEFADNFISLQDDSLVSILISLYQKVSSLPEGITFFEVAADRLAGSATREIGNTPWGELVLAHYEKVFAYYAAVFAKACQRFSSDEIFSKKYLPAFLADKEQAEDYFAACRARNYDLLASLLANRRTEKLQSVKTELQDEESLYFKNLRTKFSDTVKKAYADFFSYDKETLSKTAAQSADFVHKLYRFLLSFERSYAHEKRVRSLLDFADLEHLAIRLLVNEQGEPTETAKRISEAFDEIYIDEYQDVNELQDRIFASIAHRTDRFMVGDIKQSIYGFRGAEPSLFAGYRANKGVKTIFLSHNFRCDEPIIAFVNRVCGRLFTDYGTTVPYTDDDALVCGKEVSASAPVELHLLKSSDKKADVCRAEEAGFVAKRISGLLAEGNHPKDICILLRSASKSAPYYEKALSDAGIPCRNRVPQNLFTNPEILLVLSLLHVIDNPSRDIYLAGALKSPVFNLSLHELITVRNYDKSGSLYEALKSYHENSPTEKVGAFLAWLDSYRAMASEPISHLLWRLYSDTHILALCTANASSEEAKLRKANLMLLYDMARRFENGTYKSLYSFLCHVTQLIETDAEVPSAVTDENENVVRIMTIHQSKGLEFPIVFVSDTASSFYEGDRHERVIVDKDFGVTLKLSDDTGLASIDTFYRRASGLATVGKSADEEIRVLYVALTRAVRQLIVTGIDPNPEERLSLCRRYASDRHEALKDIFRQRNNYLDWILMTHDGLAEITLHATVDTTDISDPSVASEESDVSVPILTTDREERYEMALREFRSRFSYRYPQKEAAGLPAKLAVSDLYPSILDDYHDGVKLAELRKSHMRRPRLCEETVDTAAERGTATHQFMQFCDFDRLKKQDVPAEIQRLTELRFLDAKTAALVDVDMIRGLVDSPFFRELSEAKDLMREIRFNTRFPAGSFSLQPEVQKNLIDDTVLVQGIMDCVFTDSEGRLTLLDYKTDKIPSHLTAEETACMLIERHKRQLSYYRVACERMMCRPIERVVLYAFAANRAIEVPLDALETF